VEVQLVEVLVQLVEVVRILGVVQQVAVVVQRVVEVEVFLPHNHKILTWHLVYLFQHVKRDTLIQHYSEVYQNTFQYHCKDIKHQYF
jgi:hypothetical protein